MHQIDSRPVFGSAWLGSCLLPVHYVSRGWAISLPWLLVSFSKLLELLESCDLVAAAAAACMA